MENTLDSNFLYWLEEISPRRAHGGDASNALVGNAALQVQRSSRALQPLSAAERFAQVVRTPVLAAG
jgi:hypothetical protein